MNILIADDNKYILEGLKEGIDYESLGIAKVFLARNMQEAMDIMGQADIPLVLTDIEMPGGTGLQLLEWINRMYPETVTIFCTSFSDFDYARKAVELHSFDYYLKPIQYSQLQTLLARAVSEVNTRREERQKSVYGEYWLDHLAARKRHFWQDILLNIEGFDEEEWELLIETDHLPYSEDSCFSLGLLRLEKEKSKMDGFSRNLERFVMNNMIVELLAPTDVCMETFIKSRKNTWVLVLSHNRQVKNEQIRQILLDVVQRIRKTIHCSINVYYAYGTDFGNMRSVYNDLEMISSRLIGEGTQVIDIVSDDFFQVTHEHFDIGQWEQLFRAGNKEALFESVELYLKKISKDQQLTYQCLSAVRISALQMVCMVLSEKQIDAGYLFNTQIFDALRQSALRSVEGLQKYLECIFETAIDYMSDVFREDNAVAKVKSYIDIHYCEDITRENLGEIVYLSAGYLAASFKKKTGKTPGGYIIEKRLEKAMELLKRDEMTVSEVAIAVGYDNFTYFSRLFKKKIGKTPKEYRKYC